MLHNEIRPVLPSCKGSDVEVGCANPPLCQVAGATSAPFESITGETGLVVQARGHEQRIVYEVERHELQDKQRMGTDLALVLCL